MKISINLVTLGNLKYGVNFKEIASWRSNVFSAEHAHQVQAIPDAEGADWQYTDQQLSSILQPSQTHDFTVGIINVPLERNYYLRRLGSNVIVLSLHQTAEILHYANFTIEGFIIKNLYEVCLIYHEYGGKVPESIYSVAHDEIRGCLFDMNANKADIIFSSDKPTICPQCKVRIMQKQISNGLISAIEKELPRIKKAFYFRMLNYIKIHPIKALTISSIFAIILNVIASVIYEVGKAYLK